MMILSGNADQKRARKSCRHQLALHSAHPLRVHSLCPFQCLFGFPIQLFSKELIV